MKNKYTKKIKYISKDIFEEKIKSSFSTGITNRIYLDDDNNLPDTYYHYIIEILYMDDETDSTIHDTMIVAEEDIDWWLKYYNNFNKNMINYSMYKVANLTPISNEEIKNEKY